MITSTNCISIPFELGIIRLLGDDVLASPEATKAKTLDHVVMHLQKVIATEPRERERKRAKIALQHITKWAKHYR